MLPLWLGVYALFTGVMLTLGAADSESVAGDLAYGTLATLSYVGGVVLLLIGALWWWRSSIVEIEQGTNGVLTRYGAVLRTLDAGRHYLWHPWSRVDFVVDTATEIPYSAPVMACPTQENVPLRSIEFFLKFRITDAVLFVRTIGAGNFDLVLSSAVQDAIRQRARKMRTERPTTCAARTSPTCRSCSTASCPATACASPAPTSRTCSCRRSTSSTWPPGSGSPRSARPTTRSGA